jgi:hypothetical protein
MGLESYHCSTALRGGLPWARRIQSSPPCLALFRALHGSGVPELAARYPPGRSVQGWGGRTRTRFSWSRAKRLADWTTPQVGVLLRCLGRAWNTKGHSPPKCRIHTQGEPDSAGAGELAMCPRSRNRSAAGQTGRAFFMPGRHCPGDGIRTRQLHARITTLQRNEQETTTTHPCVRLLAPPNAAPGKCGLPSSGRGHDTLVSAWLSGATGRASLPIRRFCVPSPMHRSGQACRHPETENIPRRLQPGGAV